MLYKVVWGKLVKLESLDMRGFVKEIINDIKGGVGLCSISVSN